MRSFSAKLQLPLVLLLAIMAGFIQWYWLPNWQSQLLNERVALEKSHMAVLSEALAYPVVTGNSDYVAKLLDHTFHERDAWYSVELTRLDGLSLFKAGQANAQMMANVSIQYSLIQIPLIYDGLEVGQVAVYLDDYALIRADSEQIQWLCWSLIAAMALALLLVSLAQTTLIIRPLKRLSALMNHQVTQGSRRELVIHKTDRALQGFVDIFTDMQRTIDERHLALEQEMAERQNAERRLIDSQEVVKIGCWEYDIASQSFWWSQSLAPIMALQAGEMSCEHFYQSVHPADTKRIKAAFERLINEGEAIDEECRINAEPSMLYVHIIGRCDDENGRCFGTCQDVTAQKRIEATLRKLSSAITFSGSSVMIIDIVGTIEYVNPKYTECTGFEADEVIGQSPEMLSRNYMSDEQYDALWQTAMSGNNWRGELYSVRKDGTMFWSLVSLSPIKNEFNEISHFVLVLEDVSELKDAHARMEQLALFDELTTLANRRQFLSRMNRVTSDLPRYGHGAVMMLDLDLFKNINDTQGHQVGDELLKTVAVRLLHCIKETDLAARLGGDEFALLINPIHGEDDVIKVAERVLASLAQPFFIGETEIQVTTSIGIAMIPKDGAEPDTLLKHADLAMYQAKEMGRHQYRFFTETLHEQLQQYIRFTREMPIALENKEFELFFQPQVNLKTGDVFGAEALIRWHHPELGVVPPMQFISVAEETGFIVPLGRWIVTAACEFLSKVRQAGWPQFRLAINLSARQFRDPELIDMFEQVLGNFDIDPSCLEIEVTETLVMHDVQKAISTLQSLQALGITVAIDDFGVGYSSFSYLKTLPINVLKVDREFVKDIPDHTDDMEITAAIISMAHRLQLKVVAEGVETAEQEGFLQSHQCDFGQGYFYSKPMSEADFKAFLRTSTAQDTAEEVC
ncbi:MAG: bifunctional diguanylate cyclase/phosphodiesterase [Pontibacterium sp.]